MREAALKFVRNCEWCGVTLNEEDVNSPHTKGVFLGAEHDYTKALVRMSAKTVAKLESARKFISDPAATLDDFQELFGLLFYASRLLKIPIAEFYGPVKFYRRRLHELDKGTWETTDPAKLWPSVRGDLSRWVRMALMNEWTHHVGEAPHDDLIIFTDASVTGWGAVLFDESSGKAAAAGGKWSHKHTCDQINELEALAVHRAAEAFSAWSS
jgi:hypothetical protein